MRSSLSLGLSFLAVFAAAAPAHAQNALQDEPGYVNPRVVEGWFDGRADTEVNLEGPLLRMVAEGLREEEPEASQLLSKLKGIYVRRYLGTAGVRPDVLQERTSQLLARLEADGWQTVVRNREDGEQVNVFLKTRGDEAVSGLVVLKTEPGAEDGESVFVNIVGDVSPAEVSKLSGSLNLGSLGNLGGGLSDDGGSE